MKPIFIDCSSEDLCKLYDELHKIGSKAMSNDTKQKVKEAHKFFEEVTEKSKQFQQTIPDKKLGEKLKKVQEGSEEIVKHIKEHTE